jgi:hypothetical protein
MRPRVFRTYASRSVFGGSALRRAPSVRSSAPTLTVIEPVGGSSTTAPWSRLSVGGNVPGWYWQPRRHLQAELV